MTRRLLLSYLTITVFVLVLLEVPLAVVFEQREMDRLTADVERDAAVLATIYEDALEAGTPLDPAAAADYQRATGARVVVVDNAGISLVDTDAAPSRDFSTRPELEVALTGSRATGTRRSETLGTELLYVAIPVASGGTVHGALRVTFDTHEVTERVRRFWLGLGAVAAVVLAAVAGIGWAIARSVTRPVRHLQDTAARFASGDLTPTRPEPGSPPELVDLEAAMNAMAHRLDHLIGQQRAFVADASHQLRTPLTALRLRLENLQSDADEPERAGDLEKAVEETSRLADLVADLLQLARAEQPAEPAPCNLAQLTRDRVDTWTAIADQAGVALELGVSEPDRWVLAVPGGVEQILDNLLDNAIEAAPAGSSVVVSIAPSDTHQVLAVADNGAGLTADQRIRAVERFWHGDLSSPGTGLGLAIVSALVDASGGSISLEDNSPGGLVVSVSLPAAEPAHPTGASSFHF